MSSTWHIQSKHDEKSCEMCQRGNDEAAVMHFENRDTARTCSHARKGDQRSVVRT